MGGRRLLAAALLIGGGPAFAEGLALEANPTTVRLEAPVPVRISVESNCASLTGIAAVGELTKDSRQPRGGCRFTWNAPKSRLPQVALVLFFREDLGDRAPIAVLKIKLLGTAELQIQTEPLALVRVEVAGKSFGPVRANESGDAKVRVDVPPKIRSAEVFGTSRDLSKSVSVPLEAPPYNPLAAAIVPSRIPAGGRAHLWIFSSVPFKPGDLDVEVIGGRLGTAEHPHPGEPIARYGLLPDPDRTELKAIVHASISPVAKATASAVVLAPGEDPQVRPIAGPNGDPESEAPLGPSPTELVLRAGPYLPVGVNGGPCASAGVDATLPWRADSVWIAAEVELGVRTSELSVQRDVPVQSSVVAFPLMISMGPVAKRGSITFSGRVGGGVVPFVHSAKIFGRSALIERGVGPEGLFALEAAEREGALGLSIELRGTVGHLVTPHLLVSQLGAEVLLGLRWLR